MAGKKEQGGETGRVHVYARVRPKLEREVGDHTCVEAEEEANKCKVRIQDADAVDKVLSGNSNAVSKVTERDFEFDGVFGESSSQKEVYERVGKPVLRDVTRGYNGCIFAYGQTGSGKTFSLLHAGGQNGSDPSEAGLLPRLAASLFVHIGGDTGSTYKVECAMLQVYNEQVDDLLASGEEGRNLQVLSNSTVKGLRWEECATPDDLLKAFNRGRSNLVYAETQMNKASSRSHAMFQIKVTKRPRATKDSKGQTDSKGSVHMKATFGKLSVVDLAGSERVKRSGAGGQQLKEAANINSSLLTLGNVVQALADKKKHIPIRDSKLTRILEDSIGGNCKTSLLVCCSPAMDSGDETLNSLEFASRAMKVETHAVVNEGTVEVDADKLARDLAGEGLSSAVKEKHNELKQMETKLEEQVRSSQEELQNVKKEAERAKCAFSLCFPFSCSWGWAFFRSCVQYFERRCYGILCRSELAKKTSEKDGEVQRHKEEAKRAQEELAKLQMEVEAKQEEAERVKREMESKVERAHEEAEQKVEEVRKELNVMREEAESAKQELEKERGRFEEERNEEHRKREEAEEALRKETEEVARERDEREEHLKEKAKALERSKQEAEAAAEQRRKELQEAEERARQDLEAKEREAQDNIQAKEQELRQLREDAEKRMAAKEDSMAQERSDLEERLRRTEQEYGDYLARREEDLQNKQRELDEARQAAEETSNQLQETAQKLQEEVKAREQAEVRLEELSSQLQEKEGVAQRAEDGWRAEEERRKQVEESLQEEQELRRCDNEDSEKRRKALAASFAGARRKLELELADAKEASQRLQERLEARESREEDIARIRELEEQQLNEEKRRVEAVEEAEELRRELRNRDTNDAVFGMACKPRFRSTGLNYPRPASRFYSDD